MAEGLATVSELIVHDLEANLPAAARMNFSVLEGTLDMCISLLKAFSPDMVDENGQKASLEKVLNKHGFTKNQEIVLQVDGCQITLVA